MAVLGKGRWLELHEIAWRDGQGQERSWECVRRVAARGAASMVATVEQDGEKCLVVVKQYRPPAETYVLELPAGLIDANESIETAALRELGEETGYAGKVLGVGPFVYNSPGMSNERTALVRLEATKDPEIPINVEEEVEVLLLPLKGLKQRLLQEEQKGVHLDAKLWCFAVGLETAQQ